MSYLQVNAAEMRSAISTLESNNEEFLQQVNELNELQQELAGLYKGDAATKFNSAYASDSAQWTNFYNLIKQYIEALESMLNAYEIAEGTNTDIASRRTY